MHDHRLQKSVKEENKLAESISRYTLDLASQFTLFRDDIAAALEEGDPVGMPLFENLVWFEEEKRLQFTTNVRIDGEIEVIEWSIDARGTDLRKES